MTAIWKQDGGCYPHTYKSRLCAKFKRPRFNGVNKKSDNPDKQRDCHTDIIAKIIFEFPKRKNLTRCNKKYFTFTITTLFLIGNRLNCPPTTIIKETPIFPNCE